MTWLTPLTGLLVAAAVIPPLILLYFLKLRRRPAPVASTLLWKRSVEDLRANAPFQKLRMSLLLLLQLLAVVLVALALMQPQVDSGRTKGGRTVILIDNSASMNAADGAADGSKTRLEQAKALAKERVERLYGGGWFAGATGQVMVISFDNRAQVRTPFTDSRAQAIAAIDGIEPTDAETSIAEALELARAFTTNVDPDAKDRPIEAPAALELYSDGRIDDLDAQVLKQGESLAYTVVGTDAVSNLGVVGISADRPYDKPGQIQVFVAAANFGMEPASCDVQLSVNGTVKAITPKPVQIPAATIDAASKRFEPGVQQVAFLPFDEPRGSVIEVALLHDDPLKADNIARLVLPPAKRLRVALVDTEPFFFQDALEALLTSTIAQLDKLTAEEYEKLAAEGGLDAYDVIVLDDYAPKLLPVGRYLSFGATPPIAGLNEFGERDGVFIRSFREDHPLFRSVNFDDLFIGKMRTIAPAPEVEILAEAAEGPVILSATRGATQVLHVTFNPMDSNGPFWHSPLTFISNAIDWLGGSREAIASEGLKPGDALTTRLPAAARDIRVRLPDQTEVAASTPDPELFSWGPIRRAGLYDVTWDRPGATGRESRAFAANLLSRSEGRIAPREEFKLGQETVAGKRPGEGIRTPLWPWALGACILVLMLEWWVYVRRAGV